MGMRRTCSLAPIEQQLRFHDTERSAQLLHKVEITPIMPLSSGFTGAGDAVLWDKPWEVFPQGISSPCCTPSTECHGDGLSGITSAKVDSDDPPKPGRWRTHTNLTTRGDSSLVDWKSRRGLPGHRTVFLPRMGELSLLRRSRSHAQDGASSPVPKTLCVRLCLQPISSRL